MINKMEKSGKINFFLYKNKISTNNHKISSIKFPELQVVKSLKRSKSNIDSKINTPINQTLLLGENNIKQFTLNKYILANKIKNKTTKNESILHINEISLNKNEKEKENKRNNYSNNKINHKFYYNLICLGRNTKNEINKVNSPLVKYFLYNISQRNKIQQLNISPLYNNIKSNKNNQKKNNLKSIQPNYSLIGKELKQKYNSLNINNNNDLPNILNHRYSPIIIKNNEKSQSNTENSEGNSSSENNQMNIFIEENILKNENNNTKIENENKDYKTLNINVSSPFQGIDNLKNKKDDFLKLKKKANYNLNFFKNENKNIYKDLNPNKKLYIALKNIS